MQNEFVDKDNLLYYVLQATQDGIWDWDAKTNRLYYSDRYLSMLGYTREQFPPQLDSWINVIHPEDRDVMVSLQLAHLNTPVYGDSFECTYRIKTADGSWRWILGRGIVVSRDESGRAIRAVGSHTDITDLRNAQEALRHMLNIDPVTSVGSRTRLENELATLQTGKADPVSVIFCDVDGLKLINDNLGHVVGDNLLKTVGSILQSAMRQSDLVCRAGGDEFVVLLTACSDQAALMVVENIRKAFALYNCNNAPAMPVFVSCGCATGHLRRVVYHELLAEADKAMQKDKRQHRLERRKQLREWLSAQMGHPIDESDDRIDE